jgi:hypothetical protein
MAKARLYEFVTGFEASAQPDAGTPSLANDLVTFGYVSGSVGTDIQETPTGTVNGVNVTFTVSQTPTSAGAFQLFLDGLLLDLTTHYTRSGVTITMVTAPNFGQTLRAVYRY